MSLASDKTDFNWWKSHIFTGTFSLECPEYSLEIFSDASLSGWGAVCGSTQVNGFWTETEKQCSINYLELKAAFFGLKSFTKNISNVRILLRIDNTTAISYINRMGGIQFENLNKITRDIWQWCEARKIWIFASYIRSKENYEADKESRKLQPETEYELSFAFNDIKCNLGSPTIDLFASRTNRKCKRFISWKQDRESESVDALTISWRNIFFYAFPPFSLILKVLRKIRSDKAEGIVVVPNWPAQPWYPNFQSMLVSDRIRLNPNENLLTSCDRKPHPLWRKLTLVAGILSNKD